MMVLASILAQAADESVRLTVGGAVIMTGSIVLVVGLLIFCMSRILREPHPEEHHHAPLETETDDLNG
jgi:heme/copper-type cytochrome/quinol oxidase subunit 2